ncbi:MAG TPA: FG-GAP-like repeat-containing protein [Vicinamibacterales bacterium]
MDRTAARRWHLRHLVIATCVSVGVVAGWQRLSAQDPGGTVLYKPQLAVPEMLEPFLKHVEPGHDAFTSEADAAAIEARLAELSAVLRRGGAQAARDLPPFLAAGFRGGQLRANDASFPGAGKPFEIVRTGAMPEGATLDAGAFAGELQELLADMREVMIAELLLTAIEVTTTPAGARTEVRYDIVGSGPDAWRIEHVGAWRMTWTRDTSGWRIAEWQTASLATSRAAAPVFSEITQGSFGTIESFRRQLSVPLDEWMAALDAVLTRDSNGHHGVSVGDADGDGLEDLYVAQPSGLPNRLYRARGDGTFEDITERAGVGVLDDTASALFADVDNDGDQDLVLSTGLQPLLFTNDGRGRFAPVADAFRFAQPLQGVLTSMSMADFDRDGFLDLYLCVYSYFFGAGEDKAGTPAPYHDARNGPPGVLFRNDGRGRFIDVTKETGLDAGNDRYHFAAAWADYDADGWPDLLVVNDFGTNNLYRNRGAQGGTVTFDDVAEAAGVLDHGAGMSAAFFDYDNDGLLDIYTGNMWSASGQRVTASPAFMPDAPEEIRALYRRHARGNALFRNLGNGRFEDRTLEARAAMGRWAWSSDTIDFDSDGWEDLYVVNGMLTREGSTHDLDGFFWRQVVARSPLTRVRGTPYDEAWRAINQLLIHESIASRQRNVFLRNDGRGGFDDVSGAVGLDLDQDGRSFAVLDVDRDGDPDLALMAARQAPQLRLFRNDFAGRTAALAIRLTGTKSNRDAVGARVVVETDRMRLTKIVRAGSGFLSQHSRELLFGLGDSERVVKVTVHWPSGAAQELTGVTPNTRIRLTEGGTPEHEPFAPASAAPAGGGRTTDSTGGRAPETTWFYEPFPAPEFSLTGADGRVHSLAALRGKPAVLLLASAEGRASRTAIDALAAGAATLTGGGVNALAIVVDAAADRKPAGAGPGVPVLAASRDVASSFAILNRHLFMNRQPLRLPAALLLDAEGRVVRAYRDRIDPAEIARDAAAVEVEPGARLSRAVPFAGTFYAPIPLRNYLPYGRELMDEGLEGPALAAFERAAAANPTASTLYRLGTLLVKSGQPGRARTAFERALALQPDLAEASNDLGALLAREGDVEGGIARFRAALEAAPDYPDALNNLGYALLLTGKDAEARALYEKALALQPDFPEALNNLGMLLGRSGQIAEAERYFRDALARRPTYGEAANNLALALVAKGQAAEAVRLLEEFVQHVPEFENAYLTLARIHLSSGRTTEGIGALERLLARNPEHPVARELLRQFRPK